MVAPVTYCARGVARKAMTSAISCGCAPRPSRVVVAKLSIRSAEAPSEYTGPGRTALTLTPDGLNSAAHARVIADIDALVALDAPPPASPTAPAMLSRLTMLPRPRAAIAGARAAVSRYA